MISSTPSPMQIELSHYAHVYLHGKCLETSLSKYNNTKSIINVGLGQGKTTYAPFFLNSKIPKLYILLHKNYSFASDLDLERWEYIGGRRQSGTRRTRRDHFGNALK